VYIRGLQKPDQRSLTKIAKALSMEPSELAPNMFASALDREQPEVMLNVVPGHADKAHLVINKLVPMALGAKIISMISELDDGDER
jgi:ABC-type histidine transport system ATPase subunit